MWCIQRRIHIKAQHLPGILNVQADTQNQGHEGPIRLDALPRDFSRDSISDGHGGHRPFCLPLDSPGPSILQLASRPQT